ncbi:hydroxyethylthiazole kinase [Paucilactobacillus hokkaidonensis JCM 18461]|uniref:Hydroxyethylthiazole kinase n=2 Tax=Paucilactobacillus hokkaidonensis TaxID=1193095 RepID=A0A0A1H0B7_9LACO|nr:hydroxyethylthiazole kinase [Paucilactobacillus hokkaidonensis]BAP86709.1 hydroxyethylthiazole kinase [Paucilactobacillus hokkaidonensis JCM 18461]
MQLELLDRLRQINPIVFNISNFVTVQDVANGINAIGASPIMSEEINEAQEMVQLSSAVALNLGAFTMPQIEQIRTVGHLANQCRKPLILDPVAVGAVQYRHNVVLELLNDFDVDIIRGNAGEIAALAGVDWHAKGIDAGNGEDDIAAIVKLCAQKQQCVVILSGTIDVISDGKQVVKISNGTPLFQLHVGSGDMLTSIVGAFAAVSGDYFVAAQSACAVFAIAGQLVAERLNAELPGTFAVQLMDELHLITVDEVQRNLKMEVVK